MKEITYNHLCTSLDDMETLFATNKLESTEGHLKKWQDNINGLEEKFNMKLNERFDNFEKIMIE